MGLFSFLGGKQSNPANAAMPYLNQIPQFGRDAYNPYIQQGQQAGKVAQGQYDQMTQDPSAFINAIMGKYQESPGYQYQQQQGSRALANTAASGGYRGGQFEQQQQGELMQSLLGGDMQQWLQNNLGVHSQGLQGQQHMSDVGYNASGNLADYLGSALGQQGSLAFQGQASKNANRSNFINSLLGAGAQGFGAAAGAGMFGKGMGGGMSGGGGGYSPLSSYGNQGWGGAQGQRMNRTLGF